MAIKLLMRDGFNMNYWLPGWQCNYIYLTLLQHSLATLLQEDGLGP